MKKIILFGIIMLFCISSALAVISPAPVLLHLTINGVKPTGYVFQITDLDAPTANVITVDQVGSLRTESGTAVFDLSALGRDSFGNPLYTTKSAHYAGDRIEVKVVQDGGGNPFSCAQCTQTFNLQNNFPQTFDMNLDLNNIVIVETPAPAPSGGGSSGGGGGGGGGSVPAWTCGEWSACVNGKQERSCTQDGGAVSKESQDCLTPITSPVAEPVIAPITPVTEPPVPVEYTCKDGTKVAHEYDCLETPEQVKQYSTAKIGTYAGLGAGFIGLIIYWLVKRGKRARAKKMLDTRLDKLKK